MTNISTYYQNVSSVRGNLSDVFLNSLSNVYDIVIFTESWSNDSVFDAEVLINNYTIYRWDRDKLTSVQVDGGGVMIGVSNKLNSNRLPHLESSVENLSVSVSFGNSYEVLIYVVYIPPPITATFLEKYLDSLSNTLSCINNIKVLLLGDINLP